MNNLLKNQFFIFLRKFAHLIIKGPWLYQIMATQRHIVIVSIVKESRIGNRCCDRGILKILIF